MRRHVMLVQGPGSKARRTLQRTLLDRGYAIHTVSDDADAVGWATQHQPDLVLLACSQDRCADFKLPRATNQLPLIQLRREEDAFRLRVEPDAYLSPIPDDSLPHAIHQALAARARRLRDGILAEVGLVLPSDPDSLEELNQLLPDWFADCGLRPHQIQQFNLAVREVVANAIEWGHNYERQRPVAVCCQLEPDRVRVLVHDTGPGFDPYNLPHAARRSDPLAHLQVRAERNLRDGGFGILMASGLVDHLCYNGTGNEAQLVKFLPRRERLAISSDWESLTASAGS